MLCGLNNIQRPHEVRGEKWEKMASGREEVEKVECGEKDERKKMLCNSYETNIENPLESIKCLTGKDDNQISNRKQIWVTFPESRKMR